MKPSRKHLHILVIIVVLAHVSFFLISKISASPSNFRYATTLEATEVNVPARVASVVSGISAMEGDTVNAGQEILKLSCEDYKVAADLADDHYIRTHKLYRMGSSPKENLEQAKSKKLESDLKLKWCSITAPEGGTILTRYFEVGEWVTPGSRLFTLADLSRLWGYVYVAHSELALLSLGMKVQAFVPNGEPAQGTIVKINSKAEFTPRNAQTIEERTRLVYGVKVSFPNSHGVLKAGMSIEVAIPR
jgi:HlyD family secretion protein